MILTKSEILKIMELLQLEIINEVRGVVLAERTQGYSKDPEIGGLQAKLSIMLEIANEDGNDDQDHA